MRVINWKWAVLASAAGVLVFAGPAWSADAKAVFAKKCKACHSLGDMKGPMAELGGSLDNEGAKRDKAWLEGWLKDPKSKKSNAKMPKPKIDDDERAALVDYLLLQKK